MSCLQVIWKASGNHYGGIVTSTDAPNYEFIMPPFSLYGAKMWPLSKTITSMFMALCPKPSGLLRGCTGLILYPLRNSARESSISLTYHLQNWWRIHLLEGHRPPESPAYSGFGGQNTDTLQRPWCLKRQGGSCGFKVFIAWDLAVATESKWFWDWHWW